MARRILLGCGDSGVHDGGAGMAAALGIWLLDAGGRDWQRAAAGWPTSLGRRRRATRGCPTQITPVNPRVRLRGA
jgi:hypothetical protein